MITHALLRPSGRLHEVSVCKSQLISDALAYERSRYRVGSRSRRLWDAAVAGDHRKRGAAWKRLKRRGWRVAARHVCTARERELLDSLAQMPVRGVA